MHSMRAIRSHDGTVYSLDGRLPCSVTLETLHSVLSDLSDIPVGALIVMHPSGRQVDRDSLHSLLDSKAEADQTTVYVFDRELLDVDLESKNGASLLATLELDQDAVLADVGQDREYSSNNSDFAYAYPFYFLILPNSTQL